ncbi:MAG: S8 family serine peptidase [Parvibaculaceae bacterium]|nr:S8 family serine peptidase [Parvibaculaceae bacterium]
MTDRPILRLPSGGIERRQPGRPDKRRRPRGGGRQGQNAHFEDLFARLEDALAEDDSELILRQDPSGIAPERALVFETIVPITNFKKAADSINLEVLIESDLDDDYEVREDLVDDYIDNASPTLYATMPSSQHLEEILKLWRGYQNNEKAPRGRAPWYNMFSMLSDLRIWGPKDRLTANTEAELIDRLPDDVEDAVRLELEIWPTANVGLRTRWQRDMRARVESLGGSVISTSSVDEPGFIYEAALVEVPAGAVRSMIMDPNAPDGLATIEGLQFVLPQTIAQSFPDLTPPEADGIEQEYDAFDQEAPIRAVLLDGTPIAGHPSLDGGVVIEDVHDLVRLSPVHNRRHATSMCSLILRGDLVADGAPLNDSRLLSIPVLVDNENGATSPDDRLFVDIVHIALTRAFLGDDPLAPDAFLVNFSIGIKGAVFSGRISSLARLLDWWADQHGVLFLVSAGNVPEDLVIPNTTSLVFEDASLDDRIAMVADAQRLARHTRTLMAPSEAVNVLTVGATSHDLVDPRTSQPGGEVTIQEDGQIQPALTSAVGLGFLRSIKPDLLHTGGRHDIRMWPAGDHLRLKVIDRTQRTGLNVATAEVGGVSIYRSRGTSCSNALTSRAHINSAAVLTEVGGPFEGQELGRRDLALLTKALAVNAAQWNDSAQTKFGNEWQRLGSAKHIQAREETCRYYGHGVLNEQTMLEAPDLGATLVGTGTLKKDQAMGFEVPLPTALAGERVGRFMRVTVTWFSPVLTTRARYRLAALDVVAMGEDLLGDPLKDDGWGLNMKTKDIDANTIRRGSVWSRRLKHSGPVVPSYGANAVIPIRVQCRDASGGGLSRDDDIRFALTVTIELENETSFDIHAEIQDQLRVRARTGE